MQLRAPLPLLAALLAIAIPAAVEAQLRGRITDAGTGDGVSGATVRVTGRTAYTASSEADGAYRFDAVATGAWCIRVDHPGYEPASLCIDIVGTRGMSVDLPLRLRPVPVPPILVTGERAGGPSSGNGGTADSLTAAVTSQRMQVLHPQSSGALAELLLADFVREPPSDPPGGRHPHALYIWGSSAERGRVLLDAASVNAPLHLGALLPPLDPDLLASADLRSGGISPRYDGGTTWIMEFTTRPASTTRAWGEFDMLAGRVGGEMTFGERGGVIAGARRVNREIIDGMLTQRFGYGYADAMARADFTPNANNRIHVAALATQEFIRVPRDLDEDEASWENRTTTVTWHNRSERARHTVSAGLSRGLADLPLLSAPGGHLTAAVDRASATAERRWRVSDDRVGLTAGAEIEHLRFARRSSADLDPDQPFHIGTVACTRTLPCASARATLASAYGEALLQPARGVAVSLGTRIMFDASGNRVHVMPRAALTGLLADDWAVTLSAGRFSQTVVMEPEASVQDTVNDRLPVSLAHATHVEMNVARHWTAAFVSASAYLRHHDARSGDADARSVPGADITFGYRTRAGTMSLGYSLAGRSGIDGPGGAQAQHLAAAGMALERGPWRLNVSGAYGAGLPLTSIVLEQPPQRSSYAWQPTAISLSGESTDGAPLEGDRDYIRIDASLGAEWTFRSGARTVTVMPYARLINALSEREALFYFRNGGAAEPLARLPAVPVLGLRWSF